MKRRPWRKTEIKTKDGYRLVSVPDHPHANCNGYVMKQRLLAEKILGRYLKPEETVCFINQKKKKVVPENIIVFNNISDASYYIHNKYGMINSNNILFDGLKYLAEKRLK